jgi:hypothetical protein
MMAIRKYGTGEVLGEDKPKDEEQDVAVERDDGSWERADEEPFPQTNQ